MYFYGLIYRGEKLVLGDGKRISLFKDKVSFNGRHTYTREPFTNFYVPGCCLFGSVKRKSDICVYIIHPQVRACNPVLIVLYFPSVLSQFSAPSVCDPHENATFGRIRAAVDLLDHSVRRLRQSG